jgi:hypothetical protein
LATFAGACASTPATTSLDTTSIAVFPPNNRTGDDLLVSSSMLEKLVQASDPVTVPDLLAAQARLKLVEQGFTLVSPDLVEAATRDQRPTSATEAAAIASRNDIHAAVLYIEIRLWEPDPPMLPVNVIAALDLTLIDSATGHVLWTASRRARPIATPGAVIFGDAYVIAAHAVMEQMLRPLQPKLQS